jgi:hypothetical protein
MHYVTRRSYRIQKLRFCVICLDALFSESVLVPPKHEKLCVDVLRSEHTKMHYVTCRSHRIQKDKFGVTFPSMLFVESILVSSEHEK